MIEYTIQIAYSPLEHGMSAVHSAGQGGRMAEPLEELTKFIYRCPNTCLIATVKSVDDDESMFGLFGDFPIITLTPGPPTGFYSLSADIEELVLIRLLQFCAAHGEKVISRLREANAHGIPVELIDIMDTNGNKVLQGDRIP